MDFKEQYKDPRWQKKRLKVLEYNNFNCRDCETTTKTLHVHHPIYKKGHKIWDYETEELMCLCEDCHSRHHIIDREIEEVVADFSVCFAFDSKLHILGFMDALYMPFVRYPDNRSYMTGFRKGYDGDWSKLSVMNRQKAGLGHG